MGFFAVRMAAREWRFALRRLGVYMTSITVGVAALVALHSFRDDVVRSIHKENRSLLGADARVGANREIPDSVMAIVDSLVGLGAEAARVTHTVSMALAERSGRTRLVQLRGVEPGFPFYGEVSTDPPGLWDVLADGAALVDPALMVQLDLEIGDTVRVGAGSFRVRGTVAGLPTDIGLQAAIGPRIFIVRDRLAATGLLTRGSLARHNLYLRLPADVDPDEVEASREDVLRATQISFRTPEEHVRSLTRSADFLADFLGLVGLAALLVGGVGVGSAVSLYVRGRLTAAAVLRCVGATRSQVFSIYLLQAGWMGLLGSALGVAVGLVVQRCLPLLIRDILPVSVVASVSLESVAFGLFLGTWVAIVFALIPLVEVRKVTPLRALRHVAEAAPRGDLARKGSIALVAATVLVLTGLEAPSPAAGLAFAVALSVVAGVLWCVALGLVRGTRRVFPRRASYTVRQGVANLFRPGNQTVAVTLALGFGVMVVGVILQVQHNLVREVSLDRGPNSANMLLFDVQPNQEAEVTALLGEYTENPPEAAPVVTARIAAVNGRPVADILADTTDGDRPSRWALRREYRNTYRQEAKEGEDIVAGVWWDDGGPRSTGLPRVSLEEELARDLQVSTGDQITWRVGGLDFTSEVTSLRDIDWDGLDAHFPVVFEPGVLEDAPRTSILLAHIAGEEARMGFQQDLVRRYPNVSVLDLFTIRTTLEAILSRVLSAIRIVAGLCTVAGLVVMTGSIASTRARRRLEGALLRTLGARFRQVRRILLIEYAALGTLAALAGGLLSLLLSWLLVSFQFDLNYVPAVGAMLLLWLAVVVMTVLAGLVSGGSPARSTPLSVLRAAAE